MSQQALQQILDQLSADGADKFDPARFGYLQALSRRAGEQREPVGQALLVKAQQALALYQTDRQAARTLAQSTLNEISQLSHESGELAETLFAQGEFKKLPPLKEKLLRQQAQQLSLNDLSELTRHINDTAQANNDEDKQLTFDEFLQQQEQASQVNPVGAEQTNSDADTNHSTSKGAEANRSSGTYNSSHNNTGQIELQSMKHYREAMKYHNIDQLVNRAINEGPENPGPLNPQMLAIKSLSQMRDCSAQYSRRFATYIDTLLWLEKAGNKLPPKGGK